MALSESSAGSSSQANSIKALVAMIAGVAVGEGSVTCLPFVVGGIAERYQLADGASGMVASVQFTAMGAACVALTATVHRLDRRLYSVLGGLAIMIGHFVAIVSGSWEVFLLGRILAGVGEGLTLSIASAVAAHTANPQRTYSILAFVLVVTATILFLAVPAAAEQFGPVAVFYVLLGFSLCSFPALFFMPGAPDTGAGTRRLESGIWKPFPWALIGIACFFVSGNTLWAYAERIGTSIGMEVGVIASAFVASTVVAALGPILAHVVERRWGNHMPILLGVTVFSVSLFVLSTARIELAFFTGVIVAQLSFLFLMPFYQALTAFLDPSGRLIVAVIVVRTGGLALAPFLGGVILTAGGGFAGIGIMSVGLVAASFLLLARLARQADAARITGSRLSP